jgi:hypothetical protein
MVIYKVKRVTSHDGDSVQCSLRTVVAEILNGQAETNTFHSTVVVQMTEDMKKGSVEFRSVLEAQPPSQATVSKRALRPSSGVFVNDL